MKTCVCVCVCVCVVRMRVSCNARMRLMAYTQQGRSPAGCGRATIVYLQPPAPPAPQDVEEQPLFM